MTLREKLQALIDGPIRFHCHKTGWRQDVNGRVIPFKGALADEPRDPRVSIPREDVPRKIL